MEESKLVQRGLMTAEAGVERGYAGLLASETVVIPASITTVAYSRLLPACRADFFRNNARARPFIPCPRLTVLLSESPADRANGASALAL